MNSHVSVDDIIQHFGLSPLLGEGGWFKETYRSACEIPQHVLPNIYSGPRSYSTAIYYLLTPDCFSSLHLLPGDEIYHFYLGDPVELLQLYPDGSTGVVILGSDFRTMKLQHVVEGGVWQGSRLRAGGQFALLGTTMSPGFEFTDFVSSSALDTSRYSDNRELINALLAT